MQGLAVKGTTWDVRQPVSDIAVEIDAHINKLRAQKVTPPAHTPVEQVEQHILSYTICRHTWVLHFIVTRVCCGVFGRACSAAGSGLGLRI